MKKIYLSIVCLSLLVCMACGNNASHKPVKIERFDLYAASADSATLNDASTLNSYKDVFDVLYNGNSESIADIAKSRAYTTFADDVKHCFANTDTLSAELGKILDNGKKFGCTQSRVITVITPYNQSVMTTRDAVIIGLNHYLGANHPTYEYFETYKRQYKCKERIPFDVAEVLARLILDNSPHPTTLLDAMVYEGGVIVLQGTLMDDDDVCKSLMYNPQQTSWVKNNEKEIWNLIIKNDMLYSTDNIILAGMLMQGPFTTPFGQNTPPMLGAYLGYRLVKEYMKQTGTDDVRDVLKVKSQDILKKSKYNG